MKSLIAKWPKNVGLFQTILKQVGDSKVYVPEVITTDGLNRLFLEWSSTTHTIDGSNQYQIQLKGIKDTSRELLKVEYAPDMEGVSITFWPDEVTEKLSFELSLEEYALKSVTCADGTQSNFEYQDHTTCGWLLTTIKSFEGLTEKVTYEDNGLKFDGDAKLSALPCVKEHMLTPCGHGTEIMSTYKYERLDPESYKTTVCKGLNSIIETIYRYDKNHEVVEEIVRQGSAKVTTKYDVEPMPDRPHRASTSKRTTRVEYSKGDASREETVASWFDVNSSVVKNLQKNVRTDWYYPDSHISVDGRDDADNALALFLTQHNETWQPSYENFWVYFQDLAKQQEAECRAVGQDEDFLSKYLRVESVRRTVTGAKELAGFLDSLIGDSIPVKNSIAQCALFKSHAYKSFEGMSEQKVSYVMQVVNAAQSIVDAAIVAQRIEYYETDDFRKGRIKKISQGSADSWGNLPTDAVTDPVRTFGYTLSGTQLTTATTEMDAGGNARISSETHSILSGRLIQQIDADGNQADYTYDDYGRLTEHTTCAQSPTYKQTTIYAYPCSGRLEVTEPNGLKRAMEYDGQNNINKEYVQVIVGATGGARQAERRETPLSGAWS